MRRVIERPPEGAAWGGADMEHSLKARIARMERAIQRLPAPAVAGQSPVLLLASRLAARESNADPTRVWLRRLRGRWGSASGTCGRSCGCWRVGRSYRYSVLKPTTKTN